MNIRLHDKVQSFLLPQSGTSRADILCRLTSAGGRVTRPPNGTFGRAETNMAEDPC